MTISSMTATNASPDTDGTKIQKSSASKILHSNYIPIVDAEIKRCSTLDGDTKNWTAREAREIYKFHDRLLSYVQTPSSIYKTAANYLLNTLQSMGVFKPN